MPNVDEIAILEERLRVAELGPDPAVFEELLADDVVLVAENGQPFFAKQRVVDAHRAGAAPATCEGNAKEAYMGPTRTCTVRLRPAGDA